MAEEKSKITIRANVFGIVQGVGFRSFVVCRANEYNLTGNVANCNGYVELSASGMPDDIEAFLIRLKEKHPQKAQVEKIEIFEEKYIAYEKFEIVASILKADNNYNVFANVLLSPDLPVCEDCLYEMNDTGDRRYMYPFISCTQCGPRYSIIDRIPYDRETTTMADFEMCSDCRREYTNCDDRRFHAQTISCHKCGPQIKFIPIGDNAQKIENYYRVEENIFAVKGIGGFHLVCDAANDNSVKRLRRVKGRDNKPFAIMFLDIESIEKYCHVSDDEKELLLSQARPIVLLKRKTTDFSEACSDSRFMGCFLPYTPLQHIMIKETGPLVTTSANSSDESIIFDDKKILKFAQGKVDAILTNERRILRGLDDSVARVVCGRVQFIRRGRGVTPQVINIDKFGKAFAYGGDLKSSFALFNNGRVFMSQYFGDLVDEDSINAFKTNKIQMQKLLNIFPTTVVCDLHPNYESAFLANEAETEVVRVQHHFAHAASVMAEHRLKEAIGVVFDGTGFGSDFGVWGGEFLLIQNELLERVGHIREMNIIGGDESMKQAWKTAICYKLAAGIEPNTDEEELVVGKALVNRINCIKTTSMGRLFDAVSNILNLCDTNNYEGQAAILLENEAASAQDNNILPQEFEVKITEDENGMFVPDTVELFKDIFYAKKDLKDIKGIALGFHVALSKMIAAMCKLICKKTGVKNICLSGGVFQNLVLTELTLAALEKSGLSVYINSVVPPNDGGIALGQIYLGGGK